MGLSCSPPCSKCFLSTLSYTTVKLGIIWKLCLILRLAFYLFFSFLSQLWFVLQADLNYVIPQSMLSLISFLLLSPSECRDYREAWNHILDFTFFKDLTFFLSVCVYVYVHEMVHESAVPSETRRFQILWNWYRQLSCLKWVRRIKLCKSSPLLCF